MRPRAPSWGEPHQENPDPVALQQEEDQDEEGKDQAGGKVAGSAAEGERAADDAAGVVLQGGRGFLQVLVHLVRREVERAVRKPFLDLLYPGQRFGPKFSETCPELPAHQSQCTGNESDKAQHSHGHGQSGRYPVALEPAHHRVEESGKERGHQDRDDQETDVAEQPHQGTAHQEDQAQPPGP